MGNVQNSSMTKMSILSSLTGIILLYIGAVQMQPSLTPISDIDKDFVGLKTEISGRVIDVDTHPEGHLFLKVKDDSGGVISVPVFERINSGLNENIELLDNIQVSGQVKDYEGDLELIPDSIESIQIIHSAHVKLSQINKRNVGNLVKTRGVVCEKENVGSGSLIINLHKEKQDFPVFAPYTVANSPDFPEIKVGDTVQISGLVQVYEGKLEIKLENPYNIKNLGAPK